MIRILFLGLPFLIISGTGGMYFYKVQGIPLWVNFLFVGIYDTLVASFIFLGARWLKKISFVQSVLVFFNNHRPKGNFLNSRSIVFYPSRKFTLWLKKRKAWIVLGCNLFLGFLPGIGQITIVVSQFLEIKYAFPIIVFNNLLRGGVMALIMYY